MDEVVYMDHDATEGPYIAFGSGTGEVINTNYQLGGRPAHITQMGLVSL